MVFLHYEGLLLAGRYRLIAELGRGGMATVWRAHDELLDREVAAKEVVISDHLPEAEREVLLERTLREARLAARLNHPNIAAVYDVVRTDRNPWIMLQLVPSRDLTEVITTEGRLPAPVVARIGLEVLSALEAAHAAGVVHRDVKPANILLTDDGRSILTDFGLATAVNKEGGLTSAGMVVGTPAYIAPERAGGGASSPRSDLWSLGATLYAAVEGHAPFARSTVMATFTAVMTTAPVFRYAGPLAPVITGLLQKDPALRSDAARAREQLRQVAALRVPEGDTAVPGYREQDTVTSQGREPKEAASWDRDTGEAGIPFRTGAMVTPAAVRSTTGHSAPVPSPDPVSSLTPPPVPAPGSASTSTPASALGSVPSPTSVPAPVPASGSSPASGFSPAPSPMSGSSSVSGTVPPSTDHGHAGTGDRSESAPARRRTIGYRWLSAGVVALLAVVLVTISAFTSQHQDGGLDRSPRVAPASADPAATLRIDRVPEVPEVPEVRSTTGHRSSSTPRGRSTAEPRGRSTSEPRRQPTTAPRDRSTAEPRDQATTESRERSTTPARPTAPGSGTKEPTVAATSEAPAPEPGDNGGNGNRGNGNGGNGNGGNGNGGNGNDNPNPNPNANPNPNGRKN
ncbi:protein kinase [Streptosporangium sp. NPDC050855]|uniref:serine/threonine-protein kinase n=1 Tax=Streptosporangium sp. NPDC050855 TaxID=3366194 RepID=UPI0037958D91